MYTKILVPLDGSKLAESVLDHVVSIASGCGTAETVLVSVTEPLKVTSRIAKPPGGFELLNASTPVLGQVPASSQSTVIGFLPSETSQLTGTIGKKYSQADRYLARIQSRLQKKGLDNVKTQVLCGKPADMIVAYAEKSEVDLIVMASHGRSGLSRWASGSVADRVFRATCVPILMIRAPGCVPGL